MLIEQCVCGQLVNGLIFNRPHSDSGVPVMRCDCGVEILASHQTALEIRHYYRDGAYHSSSDRHACVVRYEDRYDNDRRVAALRWDRYRLDLPHDTKSLDVGCANGAFVDELRARGVQAYGVDPDARWAREGVNQGDLAACRDGAFDLVTYHDVLEHIVDPRREVQLARWRLAPAGLLILEVPDVRDRDRIGWKHYKREHLWYFTLRSLVDLVVEAGLEFRTAWFPVPGKLVVVACRKPR